MQMNLQSEELEMSSEKPTPHQFFRQKKGEIQIMPGEIGMVTQDGRFGRFLEPGWHQPLKRWNEQLVMRFPIISRTIETGEKMMAADGHTFTANISLRYTFNPSRADEHHLNEMAAVAMSRQTERLLREKLTRAVLYGLRNQINLYTSSELMQGQIYKQLENGVRCYLLRAFAGQGILMDGSDSIIIKTLQPSPELMEEIRYRKMAELTTALPEGYWPGMLDQPDEVITHTIKSWPNPPAARETTRANFQEVIPFKPVSNGNSRQHAN